MAFYSQHAPRIWEDLYTALIPDQVTLNAGYVRVFGVHVTGNKDVDKMLETSLTTVKIPIIKMLEYYDNGITVQIPKRESMLTIHRNIEMYLEEWRHHIQNAVNSDLHQHKDLVLGLEKFSKMIYGKALPKEVVQNPLLTAEMGLLSPLRRHQIEQVTPVKPDYNGIGQLIRPKLRASRY